MVVVSLVAIVGGASDLGYVSLKGKADQLQASLTADLQAGQRELEAGKEALAQANAKPGDPSLVARAVADFAAAKSDFLSAAQRADSSRFLHYLEYIPSVGQLASARHTAVDSIAQMGVALSDAGQSLSQLDADMLQPTGVGDAGKTLLALLDHVHKGLADVRADLQTARQAAAQVDVSVVPLAQRATFLKAKASIDSAIAGFAEFERLYPVLVEVLGGNGPRKYLVEQVNSSELRAGGGFIGTYSLIEANHGSVQLLKSGDAYADLVGFRPSLNEPGFTPQPSPYREVIPGISWSFIDSNLYPDFPSNALIAEKFVEPRIGHIDGVISMDLYTVAGFLALTGPIPVGTQVIDSGSFISTVMRPDIAQTPAHKAILAALAGPLLIGVLKMSPAQWPTLLTTMNSLVTDRHLQVFFNNALSETELTRIGWSGVLNPDSSADFMMEVEDNYWGNKVNYFLDRHFTVDLSLVGNILDHKVTVELANREPCGIEDRTTYKAVLRFYVNVTAVSLSNNLRPVEYPNPAPPPGLRQSDGWIPDLMCQIGLGHAVFEYKTLWQPTEGAVQIYWQKQPGTVNDKFDVNWNPGKGKVYSAGSSLGGDQLIVLNLAGITIQSAKAAQAQLPSLALA